MEEATQERTEATDPRRRGLIRRCQELRKDAVISSKSHYNAAERWHRIHYYLGVPAAGMTAIASISIVADQAAVAGAVAIVGSLLAAVLTALNPEKTSSKHKTAADEFLTIRNELSTLEAVRSETDDADTFEGKYLALEGRYHEACKSCPPIPKKAFEAAKADLASRGRPAGDAAVLSDPQPSA